MKKFLISILLTVSIHDLHAQLTDKLYEFSQSLSELMIALTPSTKPVKPAITNWQQFVAQNKEREQISSQKNYPVFSGVIAVTANGKYQTLQNLQKTLEGYNKSCANFYPPSQMHMTLVYFNIPIEPNKYFDEQAMVGQLANDIMDVIQPYKKILKPLSFDYNKPTIIGKDSNFLVANFNLSKTFNLAYFQEKFLMPFGKVLFSRFPNAWLSYIEPLTFHISLAKLQYNCTAQKITIPNNLPKVTSYELKNDLLKISVKGPTIKPYWKQASEW